MNTAIHKYAKFRGKRLSGELGEMRENFTGKLIVKQDFEDEVCEWLRGGTKHFRHRNSVGEVREEQNSLRI